MRDWRFSDLHDWLAIHAPITILPYVPGELQRNAEDRDRQMMENLRLRYRWADLALVVRGERQEAERDLPVVDVPEGRLTQKQLLTLRWIKWWTDTNKRSPSIRELTINLGYRSPRSVHLLIHQLMKLRLLTRRPNGDLKIELSQ